MKRKRKDIHKWIVSAAAAAVMFCPVNTLHALAETAETVQVPAYMAYTVTGPSVDISVTERIDMVGSEESVQLEVTDIVVTNCSLDVSVQVDSVEVSETEAPWTLVNQSTDFAALEADSYQFGLTADGQDLSQAPLVLTGKEIMAGKSRTIVMEGWTGPMRTSVSGVQAASLVVTVSAMEEMEEGDLSAGIIAGRVPEGGTYTAADGTVYNAGDRMPLVPADGDMLTYEEYSYQYNAWYKGASFGLNPEINGWNARVIDRMKTSYGPIARSIQGIDICSIEYCYAGCYKATAFPSVPAWVTRMSYAFDGCTTFTGTIVVDANPTVYKNAFMNTTKPIVITGACSDELKAALAATGNWENITWE